MKVCDLHNRMQRKRVHLDSCRYHCTSASTPFRVLRIHRASKLHLNLHNQQRPLAAHLDQEEPLRQLHLHIFIQDLRVYLQHLQINCCRYFLNQVNSWTKTVLITFESLFVICWSNMNEICSVIAIIVIAAPSSQPRWNIYHKPHIDFCRY